ncbi:adenine deaminase C-terminal domain-containing protein [Brevibacillus laterosporus]|uniref:adenine deaminase n=1 Tax=Brevibacillus laterosporus TaxID=1465 RepID=A0AAP8Q9N7_BRELA|nr:adenine deaminase C-terminal domain-containing protein [Brevibacillus laterosporus]MED1665574.1 adenine deaminase C-terminal domain-containing protein [Brevibacillus laterosporus]MED1668468.1 adenine deaminase C-terminal domain-containing protein [Brevibacillus laterosporus]MED1716617.1 adenine deaminase C-terminal domain-containing protein [Brevibacillus laterosporus]PPA84932.1 adenine deaminase [Brevibacillus laterosporus]PPA92912.1 adenine deaminase [Brevibacillus laterosporus]
MRARKLTEFAYKQLIRTAKGLEAASVWITGGTILDVYTKSWRKADIVLAGERIAYVGEKVPLVNEDTICINAKDKYIVPGYIEPHAHPFQWYNPFTLADYALQTGTTTMISDSLFFFQLLPYDKLSSLFDEINKHPMKQFFWARLDSQTLPDPEGVFQRERIKELLDHPLVIQAGELTDWRGILDEREELLEGMRYALDLGKRIEGHHPGASYQTLAIAAAHGVGACHESMKAEELLHRLQVGMYATLRHSSIRPDLPKLITEWLELDLPWSPRMMLTSDGATAPMLRNGVMDYTIRVAIESGMPIEEAYGMATLNPATYYGMDTEIGGIAPGRLADILLLTEKNNPTPETVIANGLIIVQEGQVVAKVPKSQMSDYVSGSLTMEEMVSDQWFLFPDKTQALSLDTLPVICMINAVISKLDETTVIHDWEELIQIPDAMLAVLIDPKTKQLTKAILRGFAVELEALATSFHASTEFLVLGRNPQSMKAALQEIMASKGGVAIIEKGEVLFHIPLPIGGKMTDESMEIVMEKSECFTTLMKERGYRFDDPIYSLLFFTAIHLPFVRFTKAGIYEVKTGSLIYPATPL